MIGTTPPSAERSVQSMTPDGPELTAIGRYVMPDFVMQDCDIAILFGTRHGLEDFVRDTIALWNDRRFGKIIISGGRTANLPDTEAECLRGLLVANGLPASVVLIENCATNTGENVIFSKALVASCSMPEPASILCIGKICSSRRYAMTVRRHWPHVTAVVHGVNYFGEAKETWWRHDEFRKRVLSEYAKIPGYISAGFVAELDDI